jgi:hypothetical protein
MSVGALKGRVRWRILTATMLVIAGVATSAAYAAWPAQRPPTYAPNGFLVVNNRVPDVSVADLARSVNPDGLGSS